MNSIKLSEEQQKIIDCNNNLVVLADPGSGKTTTLAFKIAKELKALKEYQGIIAISYTNKASKELKDRTSDIISDLKNSFFGTIDKFYISEIIIPFSKIIYNIKNDFEVVNQKDNEYSYLLEITNDVELFNEILICLKNGKIVLNYISKIANYIFDNSIECRKYLKARYKFICIDEYQDCNQDKHSLFLKLTSIGIIGIAVGDPNQSIFAFAGSSPSYIFNLVSNEDFSVFQLSVNRRSHESIVKYALKFIRPSEQIEPVEDSRVFGIKINGDESQVSFWIDNHIDNIIKLYNINNYSDICILTRGGHTARAISQTLKIPNIYYCNTPIDESTTDVDIIGKQLILYILDNDIYLENIFEDYLPNIKAKQRNKCISKLKDIKLDYIKNSTINTEKFLEVIYDLFGKESYIENISAVLENELFLNSFKPLDKKKVSVMTIHKSKGLEFKITIVLDLHKWIIPSYNFQNKVYNNIDECRCIHYVSITRAKELVILIYNTKRHNSKGEIKDGVYSEFIDPTVRNDLIIYRNKKGHF